MSWKETLNRHIEQAKANKAAASVLEPGSYENKDTDADLQAQGCNVVPSTPGENQKVNDAVIKENTPDGSVMNVSPAKVQAGSPTGDWNDAEPVLEGKKEPVADSPDDPGSYENKQTDSPAKLASLKVTAANLEGQFTKLSSMIATAAATLEGVFSAKEGQQAVATTDATSNVPTQVTKESSDQRVKAFNTIVAVVDDARWTALKVAEFVAEQLEGVPELPPDLAADAQEGMVESGDDDDPDGYDDDDDTDIDEEALLAAIEALQAEENGQPVVEETVVEEPGIPGDEGDISDEDIQSAIAELNIPPEALEQMLVDESAEGAKLASDLRTYVIAKAGVNKAQDKAKDGTKAAALLKRVGQRLRRNG